LWVLGLVVLLVVVVVWVQLCLQGCQICLARLLLALGCQLVQ
jgi:hypothetical protein